MSEQNQISEKPDETKSVKHRKVYKCDICGDEFDSKSGLFQHMGKNHVKKEAEEKKAEPLEIEKTSPPPQPTTKQSKDWSIIAYLVIIIVAGVLFYFLVLRRRGRSE